MFLCSHSHSYSRLYSNPIPIPVGIPGNLIPMMGMRFPGYPMGTPITMHTSTLHTRAVPCSLRLPSRYPRHSHSDSILLYDKRER